MRNLTPTQQGYERTAPQKLSVGGIKNGHIAQKLNRHYTRGIRPKLVTSGGRRGPSLRRTAWPT